jgi:hypothetical protein
MINYSHLSKIFSIQSIKKITIKKILNIETLIDQYRAKIIFFEIS